MKLMNSLISTLITIIITIFSMTQIFGYTKLDKINGGYKYEVFNVENSSKKELKSIDYMLKYSLLLMIHAPLMTSSSRIN